MFRFNLTATTVIILEMAVKQKVKSLLLCLNYMLLSSELNRLNFLRITSSRARTQRAGDQKLSSGSATTAYVANQRRETLQCIQVFGARALHSQCCGQAMSNNFVCGVVPINIIKIIERRVHPPSAIHWYSLGFPSHSRCSLSRQEKSEMKCYVAQDLHPHCIKQSASL